MVTAIGSNEPLLQVFPGCSYAFIEQLWQLHHELPGCFVGWVPTAGYPQIHGSTAAVDTLPNQEWRYDYNAFDNSHLLPPVFDGDIWISLELFSMPFSELRYATIGVEATCYLQNLIDDTQAHEPLLAALGGDPMVLKKHIETDLDRWKSNTMTPLFVFEGQSTVGKDDMALRKAKAALAKTHSAWEFYVANHPAEAVKTFGLAGAVRATDLYRILQDILFERGLNFIVAPFSACAQLAYLESLDTPYIDGIMGSQELLLYDIHDAIISTPCNTDWEKKTFSGIIKSDLIKKMNVTPEMFADALLMVGTSFLSPFPPLQDESIISRQPFTIGDAINLLRTSEKSVTNTCAAFSDILQLRDPNWLDKFRKAKMGVRHCVTVHEDGSIHIRDFETLTQDNHEYLGLQLPPELYHYLSKVVIGPRLMNCFGSLESLVLPTLDGVASDEYKRLVTRSLLPVKEATAALISSRIHRGFQFKDITMRFWFDDSLKQTLNHRTIQPHPNQQADTWGVKDPDLHEQETATGLSPGKLSFAILSLQDKQFATKTISKGRVTGLDSKTEVLSNVLYRLLHIRGYINDQHELTSWGKALALTLQAIGPTVKTYNDIHHLEEAAFLAYELLRFDNLNTRNRHSELIGGPFKGTEEDKANCILIGRTACLIKLRHDAIGYTGPLSKNFLSYHSIIKAIREADRDLLEAVIASMFLNNQATRNRDDFTDIGRSLLFSTDVNVSLGIAVKTYFDDFLELETSAEERKAGKDEYVQRLLPYSVNFAEDLEVAFGFFDALHEGVKTLSDELGEGDIKDWENAEAYLAKRR